MEIDFLITNHSPTDNDFVVERFTLSGEEEKRKRVVGGDTSVVECGEKILFEERRHIGADGVAVAIEHR